MPLEIHRPDLPFAVSSEQDCVDGLYAVENENGRISVVGVRRDGQTISSLVIDGQTARLETIDHFAPSADGIDPSDPGDYKAWLQNALSSLQDRAEHRIRCAFCGKGRQEVKKIVMGPTVGICNECVSLCDEIIRS